jgi:predicted N-acyltransferase
MAIDLDAKRDLHNMRKMDVKTSALHDNSQMTASPCYSTTVVGSLASVSELDWQVLAGDNPFMGYSFLNLLQETGCASPGTGWQPRYLLLKCGDQLIGAAPCFLKMHSRGEFVFDQAWAQAFERQGLQYYPKLVVAAPFTPVQGPRLLARNDDARAALAIAVQTLCKTSHASSVHVLFVEKIDRDALSKAGYMLRQGIQFHWQNDDYGTLQDFLSRLSHDKRKKILQDGRYVSAAGITYDWLEDQRLRDDHLEFFYSCYANTYREHGSRPYLTLEFFKRAHMQRVLQMVLILAKRGNQPVACALNVRGGKVLYGRYWGTTEMVKGLHFETCYMQSIAYCIETGLSVFEGGAQGEHKMARGLMPVKTYSAHYVADRQFAAAIGDFLGREGQAVDGYVGELKEASPFRHSMNHNHP